MKLRVDVELDNVHIIIRSHLQFNSFSSLVTHETHLLTHGNNIFLLLLVVIRCRPYESQLVNQCQKILIKPKGINVVLLESLRQLDKHNIVTMSSANIKT